MPEGPEAHTMAADIKNFLASRPCRLTEVEVCGNSGHYAPRYVHSELAGKRELFLLDVTAVGKKVVFAFAETPKPPAELYLVSSLAMSGLWQLNPSPWTRMRLAFEQDDGTAELFFNDPMGWGWLGFSKDLRGKLRDVGPDIFTESVTPEVWARALKRPEPICWLLVQQKRISGLGNYLRADILYRAGIAPQTVGHQLSDEQLERLLIIARELTAESYKRGGHSFENYFRVDGGRGEYSPLIYGRSKCPLGHAVDTFLDQEKRKCYYCRECQH